MADAFNKERILRLIDDGLFAGGVHLLDSIDSTNQWSLDELKRGRELPFACIADHQHRGRGRRGRHWLSPPGANIYMSLAWHFELPVDRLAVLALSQGIVVIKALRKTGISEAWLKWPNDVLVNGEKIAGVLVETGGIRANSCNAVIGIGLNYQMPENLAHETGIHCTDVMRAADGKVLDRSTLAAILLEEAVRMCRLYQKKTMAILNEFRPELDVLNGQAVSLHLENNVQIEGKVLGINPAGELRVLVEGRERIFNSADVSLKTRGDQYEACGSC